MIAVQCGFCLRFNIQPPTRKSISRWNHQFEQIGCLCKVKSSGRPRVSEENVTWIQESFERSPCKSTRRASRELWTPQPTVWRVLRRRLLFNWVHLFESPCIWHCPDIYFSSGSNILLITLFLFILTLFSKPFMISDRREKDKDSELIGCKHL